MGAELSQSKVYKSLKDVFDGKYQVNFHSIYKKYLETLKILDLLEQKRAILLQLYNRKKCLKEYLNQLTMTKKIFDQNNFGGFINENNLNVYWYMMRFLQMFDQAVQTYYGSQTYDMGLKTKEIIFITELKEKYQKNSKEFLTLKNNLRKSEINEKCQHVMQSIMQDLLNPISVTDELRKACATVKRLWNECDYPDAGLYLLGERDKEQKVSCIAICYYEKFVRVHTDINQIKKQIWQEKNWFKRVISYIYPEITASLQAQEDQLTILYNWAETLSNHLRLTSGSMFMPIVII